MDGKLNRKSAVPKPPGAALRHDRYWLPSAFRLAGKLLKNCFLPHVLGENYGG
jgi:hypothetical protein